MVTEQLSSDWEERDPEAESKLMAAALARVADLPNDRKIQAVDKLFEGKSGKERRDSEAEFASKISKAPNSNPSTRSRSSSPLRRPIFAPSTTRHETGGFGGR